MSDTANQPMPDAPPVPEPPATPGVLGDGGMHAGKYNMALVRRAIRNDWPIPEDVRARLVAQMELIALAPRSPKSKDEPLDSPSNRDRIAAAKVVLAADAINTRREQIDVAGFRAEMMPTVQQSVTVAPSDNAQTQVNVVNIYLPSNGRD